MNYEKNKKILNDFRAYMEIEEGLSKMTISIRLEDISKFIYAFKDKEIKDITVQDMRAYLIYHKEHNMWKKKTTFARRIASLKKFFKYLCNEEIITHDPTVKLSSPQRKGEPEIKFITPEEMKKLLKVLHTPLFSIQEKAMFHLLLSTGMRVDELVNLKRNNQYINIEKRTIFLPKTKTKMPHYIKFSETAQYYLKIHLIKDKLSNSEYFFHQKNSDKRIWTQQIRVLIKKIIKAVFINWNKPIGPHLLRHTFAMDWMRNQGDIKQLQWIMGWTNLKMTEVYTHQTEGILDDAYARYERVKKKKGTYWGRKKGKKEKN